LASFLQYFALRLRESRTGCFPILDKVWIEGVGIAILDFSGKVRAAHPTSRTPA